MTMPLTLIITIAMRITTVWSVSVSLEGKAERKEDDYDAMDLLPKLMIFSESGQLFKMEGKAAREEELAEVLRGVAGGVAVRL